MNKLRPTYGRKMHQRREVQKVQIMNHPWLWDGRYLHLSSLPSGVHLPWSSIHLRYGVSRRRLPRISSRLTLSYLSVYVVSGLATAATTSPNKHRIMKLFILKINRNSCLVFNNRKWRYGLAARNLYDLSNQERQFPYF